MIDMTASSTGTPFGGSPLPAAVAVCLPEVRPASGAPFQATGPFVSGLVFASPAVAGPVTAVRRRDLTGADWTEPLGDEPTTAPSYALQPMTGIAVLGAPAHRTTPGDLPPEDPLS